MAKQDRRLQPWGVGGRGGSTLCFVQGSQRATPATDGGGGFGRPVEQPCYSDLHQTSLSSTSVHFTPFQVFFCKESSIDFSYTPVQKGPADRLVAPWESIQFLDKVSMTFLDGCVTQVNTGLFCKKKVTERVIFTVAGVFQHL